MEGYVWLGFCCFLRGKTVWVIGTWIAISAVVVLPLLDLGAWDAWPDDSAISIRHKHPSLSWVFLNMELCLRLSTNNAPPPGIIHHFDFSVLLKMSEFVVESRHRGGNSLNYVPKTQVKVGE